MQETTHEHDQKQMKIGMKFNTCSQFRIMKLYSFFSYIHKKRELLVSRKQIHPCKINFLHSASDTFMKLPINNHLFCNFLFFFHSPQVLIYNLLLAIYRPVHFGSIKKYTYPSVNQGFTVIFCQLSHFFFHLIIFYYNNWNRHKYHISLNVFHKSATIIFG